MIEAEFPELFKAFVQQNVEAGVSSSVSLKSRSRRSQSARNERNVQALHALALTSSAVAMMFDLPVNPDTSLAALAVTVVFVATERSRSPDEAQQSTQR